MYKRTSDGLDTLLLMIRYYEFCRGCMEFDTEFATKCGHEYHVS